MVPSGHTFVSQRLRSAFSATGMMEEMTGGVSYLFFLRGLASRVGSDWEAVRADLAALHGAIFARRGLDWNITSEEEHKKTLFDGAAKLANALPASAEVSGNNAISQRPSPAREALLLPAQVNYVGWGGNLYDAGYAYHGSVHVILKQLRTGWLWEKVRVQGGAYGAFCAFDRMSGAFVLASYRDPNVRGTLDIFARTAGHLASMPISRRELDAAIIGAMGEVDAYMLPDAKGSAAHTRALVGDTQELRRKMRDEILATTPEHFHAFAAHLEKMFENGKVCVLGGDTLEKTAKNEDGWESVKVL
jgi:Zn-dependent M16 (insulinase) family peptidase